jgi:hypothetical protein
MNARIRNQYTRAYNAILYRNGLVQPTYEKGQSAAKKFEANKLRDKMTSNWKEIADATGFNYDGTMKV